MEVVTADSSLGGREASRLVLRDVPSPISLRELIRLRVREQVATNNANLSRRSPRLVEPSAAEIALNGDAKVGERLRWEQEADKAISAFERNRFFVFIGERQVDELDVQLTFADAEVVRFVQVFPLVGG
jgi:hypothetical protein